HETGYKPDMRGKFLALWGKSVRDHGGPDRLADLAGGQEGLVAEVVVLADEGLELAEPVGVAAAAGDGLYVEVALEMGQVPFEGGDLRRCLEAAHDLLHGEGPAVVAEDRVDRVVRDAGLLDEYARLTEVVEGAPDLVADRAGDRRREGVAYLPVDGGLPAGERPAVAAAVPALQAGDHLTGQLREQGHRVVPRRRGVGD